MSIQGQPSTPLLCPGILAAKTWVERCFSPRHRESRIEGNQHSCLTADEHLSMHLSALQRTRPWSRNLISRYSTEGRRCCTGSWVVSLEMERSKASNVASALGAGTDFWRCLYLSSCKGIKLSQTVQNGLHPASSINQFKLFGFFFFLISLLCIVTSSMRASFKLVTD